MNLTLQNAVVIGNQLALSFDNGDELYLDMAMLRRACPCANCQGEPDALGRVARPVVNHGERSYELVKFEMVGSYALQLFWGDGHSSGIYGIAYLKGLADLPG